MNIIAEPRGVYAQSSDIKSRTYLKYRFDMKRKAIAELEVKDWFEDKLKELHETEDVALEKSGGDAHIWFLRTGGQISGEPDYTARIKGKMYRYEFQYANQADLDHYDFKVSKVGKKVKKKRIAHTDREFLYILKPTSQFAIFSPSWVLQNGNEAGVPAWGNRTAYRVPRDTFLALFAKDDNLAGVIEVIEVKNRLLNMQENFTYRESGKLSAELQYVVDQEKAFTIIPKTLGGFYQACFLMGAIGQYPTNYDLWLVFGGTYYSKHLNSYELAQLVYSLDFLYGGADELHDNVLESFVETMEKISNHLTILQENEFRSSADLSPRAEVENFLFAVNLYEDIVQELRHAHEIDCFAPITKIFQTIQDTDLLLSKLSNRV